MKIDAILPQAIAWGKTNKEQHAGFQALWCTLDHVLPRSRGGTNDPANLVTACYMCHFGRAHFTLEEVGFADPRCREPVKSEWDGLTRLLTAKVQV